MKVETGKIFSFKLTSGQEMVGMLSDIDDEYYYVDKPLTIGQSQKGGMEFIAIMFTGVPTDGTPVLKHSIAMITETREDVMAAYEDSVNPQAIITPKKQIITG